MMTNEWRAAVAVRSRATTAPMLALLLCALPTLATAQTATAARKEAAPEIVGPVLLVSDLERSMRFYVDGLGLKVFRRLPPSPGPGAVLVADGKAPPPHILIRQAEAAPGEAGSVVPGRGLSRIMLAVADSSAVAERLRSAGFQPTPLNPGKIFFVTDPDGYRYEIIQTARAK